MPPANADLSMSLVESLLNGVNPDPVETTTEIDGVPNGHGEAIDDEEEEEMDEGTVQVRTMAIPRWLSTMDVTSKSMSCIRSGSKNVCSYYLFHSNLILLISTKLLFYTQLLQGTLSVTAANVALLLRRS